VSEGAQARPTSRSRFITARSRRRRQFHNPSRFSSWAHQWRTFPWSSWHVRSERLPLLQRRPTAVGEHYRSRRREGAHVVLRGTSTAYLLMYYALILPTRTGVGQESSQAYSNSNAREAGADSFEALASTSVYRCLCQCLLSSTRSHSLGSPTLTEGGFISLPLTNAPSRLCYRLVDWIPCSSPAPDLFI